MSKTKVNPLELDVSFGNYRGDDVKNENVESFFDADFPERCWSVHINYTIASLRQYLLVSS